MKQKKKIQVFNIDVLFKKYEHQESISKHVFSFIVKSNFIKELFATARATKPQESLF